MISCVSLSSSFIFPSSVSISVVYSSKSVWIKSKFIYHTITIKLVSIPWDCYTPAIRSIGETERMATRLKVKEIAERKGMSQRQLFFRSQVDLKTIQRMYRYPTATVITTDTLDKLARALHVDASLLVDSD